jgi:hypothetical protein
MAAQPTNSTCTIDGTSFDALEIKVALKTTPDRSGMPLMSSLQVFSRVVVDISDTTNIPYSTLSMLFNLANVTTADKIKDIKIEYWKDDAKQDALCSYKFKGWVSGFQTVNPQGNLQDVTGQGEVINHMLVIDLQPSLNQQNFPSLAFSN